MIHDDGGYWCTSDALLFIPTLSAGYLVGFLDTLLTVTFFACETLVVLHSKSRVSKWQKKVVNYGVNFLNGQNIEHVPTLEKEALQTTRETLLYSRLFV